MSSTAVSMSKVIGLAVGVVLLGGCVPIEQPRDGSVGRDAALADGGGLFDGGRAPVDGAPDAPPPIVRCEEDGCDPRTPGGCGPGMCVLWDEASSCQASEGALPLDAPCVYTRDCVAGLACFATAAGGVCGRVCCPGDGTCDEGSSCGGSGVLVDGTETRWGRCLPPRACDVLNPAADCEDREACYIVDTQGNTECRVAGIGVVGASCNVQEDCAAGFFCGGIRGSTRCVRICELDGAPCPSGEGRCVAQVHSPAGTGLCTIDATTRRE